MFEQKGRILTIHKISEKVSQVVIKIQYRGKQNIMAFATFGYSKIKMEALNLNINDKVLVHFMFKSNFFKTRYHTDVNLEDIKRYEKKPKYNPMKQTKPEHELFFESESDGGIGNSFIIDEETGEILL